MKLYVEGMTCEHCKMHVEKALKSLKGVKSASVDLEKGTAEVKTKKEIPFDIFRQAIEDAGYKLTKIE